VTKIYLALDEECASGMADGLSQTRDQGDLREVLGVEVPPDKAAQQLGRVRKQFLRVFFCSKNRKSRILKKVKRKL
jgi:hypothetical protein